MRGKNMAAAERMLDVLAWNVSEDKLDVLALDLTVSVSQHTLKHIIANIEKKSIHCYCKRGCGGLAGSFLEKVSARYLEIASVLKKRANNLGLL